MRFTPTLAPCRSSSKLLSSLSRLFSYPFSFAFRAIDISVKIVCDAPSIRDALASDGVHWTRSQIKFLFWICRLFSSLHKQSANILIIESSLAAKKRWKNSSSKCKDVDRVTASQNVDKSANMFIHAIQFKIDIILPAITPLTWRNQSTSNIMCASEEKAKKDTKKYVVILVAFYRLY